MTGNDLGQAYFYPNKMGRIVILALEEVIGHNSVNLVLSHSKLSHLIGNYPADNLDMNFSFSDLSQIQMGLEHLFGPRAGRGIALRSGRVCFKYGLREFGPMLGITEPAFRLAPLNVKLRSGAEIFADIFNRYTDQRVRVEEDEAHLKWHIGICPVCWQRSTDTPVCHLAVGILQESLYWISGGKIFKVEETNCIAKGDPSCTIVIQKQALD